jgi:hypothetical protein
MREIFWGGTLAANSFHSHRIPSCSQFNTKSRYTVAWRRSRTGDTEDRVSASLLLIICLTRLEFLWPGFPLEPPYPLYPPVVKASKGLNGQLSTSNRSTKTFRVLCARTSSFLLTSSYPHPATLPQQCLYFFPDPQPQGSLRPIFRSAWLLPPPNSAAILRRSGPKYS